MGTRVPSFGPDLIQIGTPNASGTAVPSLSAATVAIAAVTPTTWQQGTARQPLAAATYNVWVALAGFDPAGGFTLAVSSATPGAGQAITSGQALQVRIASANFPAGMSGAVAAMLFVQKAAENPVATDWAFIDTSGDFSWPITTYGDVNAPNFPVSTLTANVVNSGIGSTRTPYPVVYSGVYRTADGIAYTDLTEGFEYRIDNAPNFRVVTTRSCDVEFKVADATLLNYMLSVGGDYCQYTDSVSSKVIQTGTKDVYSIASQLTGNGVVYAIQPRANNRTTKSLMLGQVTANVNQVQNTKKKDAQTVLDFKLEHAPLDTLVCGMGNTLFYSDG